MANKNGFFKLELLLLTILSKKDCYGYELSKTIKQASDDVVVIKDGTMYPILYKLLENKYISSYNVLVGTKVRVYYKIEELGLKKLEDMLDDFEKTVNGIYKIINYDIKQEDDK